MNVIVGIDLGTTNSAVAVWRNGRAELIPNSLGDTLTPSAVGLGDKGELLVGLAARERQSTHPELTATTFKRLMGTSARQQLGRRSYAPEELSSLVLKSLAADAEAHLGAPVSGVVITVPAYFNDRQRKATRRAGELAGLRVERLVNEPTAAALAYGIHEREDKEPFLVFDLGGGTFDVSIVEIFERIVEVRASAGDNRLGGEDFNEIIVNLAEERIEFPGGMTRDSRFLEVMRVAAERTRRALTDMDTAPFRMVWEGHEYTCEITAAAFEDKAESLLARLREPVLRSMRDSNIRSDDLSEIVLVGGGTRMPIVRRVVTRMFGRFPNATVDADHAVALGAAVQAGLKSRDADLAEVRLTDVCPFTLGIEVSTLDRGGRVIDGLFSPVIERNTVLPASRVREFATMADNQSKVDLKIYQGEARTVRDNVWLGAVTVQVPPRPRGEVRIDCRFSYDVSGLLEVDVIVPETGLTRQLIIHNEEDEAGSLESRRAALAKLKFHPREDNANAAALARAGRCYESMLGEMRDYVGRMILEFEGALERQDPRQIDEARLALEEQLDQVEGERFL
jgi:molecular chaperone HscC